MIEMSEQQIQECDVNCPKLKWVFRLLVAAQFVVAGLIFILLQSTFTSWPTTLMAVFGLFIAVWSFAVMGRSINVSPELKQSAQLKTTGPYRFVRHPMYLALLMFCGGYVVADGSMMGLAYWVGLLAILSMKIYYEERMLRNRFPVYNVYCESTKRLIPFFY